MGTLSRRNTSGREKDVPGITIRNLQKRHRWKNCLLFNGLNSACKQRMIYTSLSSKKESGTFIHNLIMYNSREVRILVLGLCYSHSHINMTVNKIKKSSFFFFLKPFLSPVEVSRTRRQKEPK